MKEPSIYAKAIFKERKITEYLAKKGIFPSREHGNRKMYICPVHEGDSAPSMTVFTDSEYENYYCFACHSGTTIINLVADMEKIDTRQSFKMLVRGLDISSKDVMSDCLLNHDKFIEDGNYEDLASIADVEEISLKISVECYNFLKNQTDFDSNELEFFETVLKKIDLLTNAKDKESLRSLFYFLTEEGIPHRAELFYEKEEKKAIQNGLDMEAWRLV